jgi:hypothetical protein
LDQEARRDWRSQSEPGKAATAPALNLEVKGLNLEVKEVEVEEVTVT